MVSPNERIPGAEPAPEWPAARNVYQWAWELHYIGLTLGYIGVALCALVVLLLLFKGRNRTSRKPFAYHYAVHILLVIFGSTRATFLLTDPYELNLDYPLVSTRLLFGLGFPCLTSGYSLLHFSFLYISRAQPVSGSELRRKRFVYIVIALHFTVVIIADTTTALKRETALLLLVCMSFFIFWGLAISVSILYSGMKVLRECQKRADALRSQSQHPGGCATNYPFQVGCTTNYQYPGGFDTQTHSSTRFPAIRRPNRSQKAYRVTILTAVLAMSCCICNLVALVGVFKVYRGVKKHPGPWEWWVFQTVFRLIEIALAIVMGYSVTPVNLFGTRRIKDWKNVRISMKLIGVGSRAGTESAADNNQIISPSTPHMDRLTEATSMSCGPDISAKTKVKGLNCSPHTITGKGVSLNEMHNALFPADSDEESDQKSRTLSVQHL